MNTEVATFLVKKAKAFSAFRRALSTESDRGCALFAAAYLEHELLELIRAHLVQNDRFEDDLVRSNGALHSLSSRIKFAYYLGALSCPIRRDLDIVRAIRNEFAHHPEYITFDEPSVADRCRELTYTWHEKNERPRAHYAATVSGIVAIVHASIAHAVSPSEATHTPIDDELRKRINALADAALQSLKTDGNKPPENGDG